MLPDNIDKDSNSAKFEDGILTIELAKKEPEAPKEIKISIS
jgi:HSP20 family molecular chaperone IbpA